MEANTNAEVVDATLLNNELTLSFIPNQVGTAFITIKATSNGQSIQEIFKVNVKDISNNILYKQSSSISISGFRAGEYTNATHYAADDFTVPSGQTWDVEKIIAYSFAIGTEEDPKLIGADVFFYQDINGLPGDLVSTQSLVASKVINLPILNQYVPKGYPTTFVLNSPVNLQAGKYWVRVYPKFNVDVNDYRWVWYSTVTPGNARVASPATKNTSSFGFDFVFDLLGQATGTVPTAPTGLTAKQISNTQTQLNWTADNKDNNGFIIERMQPDNTFKKIGTTSNIDSWIDNTGLSVGNTYTYRIRSFDRIGESAPSAAVSITLTITPISTPINFKLTEVTKNVNRFEWEDNLSNEEGFEIARSFISGKSYGPIKVTGVDQNISELIVDTLEKQDFFYVVRALTSQGKSGFSNEVLVLRAPEKLEAVISSENGVALNWQDNSKNETGYIVERSWVKPLNFQEIARLEANTTSYIDNTIERSGGQYKYRIKAIATNGFSAYSNQAEVDFITAISTKPLQGHNIKIYPNPTADVCIVSLEDKTYKDWVKAELWSPNNILMDTQFMAIAPNQTMRAVFNVSYLPKGVYIVKVQQKEKASSHRIVVE